MDCMNALDTDMTDWWEPTGDSNLSHGQETRLDPTFFILRHRLGHRDAEFGMRYGD